MEFRYFKEKEDYDKLCDWWKFWRFTPPSIEMLPRTGVIVNNDGVDVACGFLYLTDSKMCWIEFVVSNPLVKDKKVRSECIDSLLNQLCGVAKELEYKIVFASIKNENLANKYIANGFLVGCVNSKELIKII